MAVEHGPRGHESKVESQHELEALAAERQAEREASAENKAEGHVEKQHEDAETARKIIDKQDQEPEEPAKAAEAAPPPTFAARLNQALSYRETMASVQQKLTPVQRSFSRVIHAPAVEKVSEVLEDTVMRPSVTMGAVITTLLVGSTFYYFAHRYGYAMRGSEFIVTLIVGGLLGLLVEGIWRAVRPRH